jgi:beta-N-acetylhexosaminidase
MSPRALRHGIGRLLIAGFEGHQVPIELKAIAREFGLGGVILFGRNIEEPAQVAELAYEAARLTPEAPLWVSVDQEGGRVARLKAPFTAWPPMATLGRSGDLGLAGRFARALAAELSAVGITLDFAPVLDVCTNPGNPVIGDRAIGDRAEDVARIGAAVVRALQEGGVAACGKHFPGHGDTSADSHLELPLVEHPPERLRAVEWQPFRAAVEAGVAMIMTAHVLVPALDESRPATLSPAVVTGALRGELGFEGVIVSDDLEMKAITNQYGVPEAAVLALAAGCDALLVCGVLEGIDYARQAAVLEALVHAVEEERVPFARVEDALTRQQAARDRFLAPAISARPAGGRALRQRLPADAHRAVADEMARFL